MSKGICILSKYFTENDFMKHLDKNKFKYIIPEKRKVSQIFISNLKNDKEQNSKLIKSVFEKFNNGEKFGNLAKKYSDDKLSNKNNGDIGWVSRNEVTKIISDEIFKLKSK